MKRIISILFLVVSAVFTIGNSGCTKPDDSAPVAAVDSGKVDFHIHTYLGEEEVDGYNLVYTLDDGRKVSLSLAQFYISDIQLVKADGTYFPLAGKILFKTREQETYDVGAIPVGAYKAVRFKIGLDDATNALNATGNGLLNHPEMWYGSTAQPDGYIYLNAQGKIDTSADASGTTAQMQPFIYRIGTSGHYVQVTMPDHSPAFTITKGNTEFVHMLFDYSKLFNGVTLSNPANLAVSTNADNSSSISTTIANNIAGCFRYEE